MRATILLVFTVGCGIEGGSIDADAPALRVAPLAVSPGCFTPPPVVPCSAASPEAEQRCQEASQSREVQRVTVFARLSPYPTIVAAMRQDPDAGVWTGSVDSQPMQSSNIATRPYTWDASLSADGERFAFTIDVAVAAQGIEDGDRHARGGVALDHSELEDDAGWIQWTGSALRTGSIIRGCDPKSGASFEELGGGGMRCWLGDQYVSCSGVDTWPE